jgi:hypothetical protein
MFIPFRYFAYVAVVVSVVIPRMFPNTVTDLDALELNQSRADALTFVTYLPPAPSGDALRRYRIAMTSWLITDPRSRLVAIARNGTTHKLAAALQAQFRASRVLFADAIKRDWTGNGPVSEWVAKSFPLIRTRIACFISPEVVVDQFWADTVLSIARNETGRPVHVTGQRLDVNLSMHRLKGFDFGGNFSASLTALLKSGKVSCLEQVGSEYFVWRMDRPPFRPSEIPAFKFGGYFWDQWMNGFAASTCPAFTLKLHAPIYSLAEPPGELNMSTSGPIVANAHFIKDKKLVVTHAALIYVTPSAADGKPILPVPKCQGIQKVPTVNV